MNVLGTHLVIGFIFGIIALLVGYVWLGVKLTGSTADKYQYNMWNWITIIVLLYMSIIWIIFLIGHCELLFPKGGGFIAPEGMQDLIGMWVSTAIAFVIIWIRNSLRTSLFWGFVISVYQSSVCFGTILLFFVYVLILGGVSGKK